MNSKKDPKEVKKGCGILVLICLIGIVITVSTCEKENLTPLQHREKKISDLLYHNGRNSVNIKLMTLIQNDLNDPDSMENLDLNYIDMDSIILIKKSFTAKNALGGRLRKDVEISIDTLGNIIAINKWFK